MKKKRSSEGSDKSSVAAQIEIVEELYRLADLLHSGIAELDPEASQRRNWAGQRFRRLIDHEAETSEVVGRSGSHAWIIDVLSDLVHYADSEGLDELSTCLRDTLTFVEELLGSGDGVASPESSDDESD